MARKIPPLEQLELYAVPEPNSGCWIWTGTLNNKGYGRVALNAKQPLAHRFFYKWFKGDIPEGLELDHLCRVRCCVNPDHLEPVTRTVNVLRGDGPEVQRKRHRGVTHCPQGHEYTDENTWYHPGKPERHCRECHRIKARAYHYKNREKRLEYMRTANRRRKAALGIG
jgi:hypothetical protein